MTCRFAHLGGYARKQGFTLRCDELASGTAGAASCRPVMPKRMVAAVLVACLVLLGSGVLASFVF
jgi:hypothetical protein